MNEPASPIGRYGGNLRYVNNPAVKDPARLYVVALCVLPVVAIPASIGVNSVTESVFAAVGLFMLAVVASVFLFLAAERTRRENAYRITAAEFWFSGRQIRDPLRRIFDSVESIASTEAFKTGAINSDDLHRAVYSAADTALYAKRIRAQIKATSDRSERAHLLAVAETLEAGLLTVESDFRHTAGEATTLSRKMTRPLHSPSSSSSKAAPAPPPRVDPAVAEYERASAAAERFARREQAKRTAAAKRDRATETASKLNEEVSSFHAGYSDADRLTRQVLGQSELIEPPRPQRDSLESLSTPCDDKPEKMTPRSALRRLSLAVWRAMRRSLVGRFADARVTSLVDIATERRRQVRDARDRVADIRSEINRIIKGE